MLFVVVSAAFLNCGVGKLTTRYYNFHEQIEVLASLVSSVGKEVESSTILDVGAGQVLTSLACMLLQFSFLIPLPQ